MAMLKYQGVLYTVEELKSVAYPKYVEVVGSLQPYSYEDWVVHGVVTGQIERVTVIQMTVWERTNDKSEPAETINLNTDQFDKYRDEVIKYNIGDAILNGGLADYEEKTKSGTSIVTITRKNGDHKLYEWKSV